MDHQLMRFQSRATFLTLALILFLLLTARESGGRDIVPKAIKELLIVWPAFGGGSRNRV